MKVIISWFVWLKTNCLIWTWDGIGFTMVAVPDILSMHKSHICIPALLKSHKCIPGAHFFSYLNTGFPVFKVSFIYPWCNSSCHPGPRITASNQRWIFFTDLAEVTKKFLKKKKYLVVDDGFIPPAPTAQGSLQVQGWIKSYFNSEVLPTSLVKGMEF